MEEVAKKGNNSSGLDKIINESHVKGMKMAGHSDHFLHEYATLMDQYPYNDDAQLASLPGYSHSPVWQIESDSNKAPLY